MINYFEKRLSAKILTVLIAIIVLSFTALGYSVLSRQDSLLDEMADDVNNRLQQTANEAKSSFTTLEGTVSGLLDNMGQQTVENLTAVTTKALSSEEKNISQAMEQLLLGNAKAIAAALSNVAERGIMTKEYEELVMFSRAVAKTDDIVYLYFMDKDGNLLPGYINLIDDKIIDYLKNISEEVDEDDLLKAGVVLKASREDPAVLLYEQVIEYYGLPIGKIIVGVNKTSTEQALTALAGRFENIKTTNEQSIKTIIDQESGRVTQRIQSDLAAVVAQNEGAMTQTGEILTSSAQAVESGTSWGVMVIGVICSLGTLIAVAIMLRIMVIKPILEITAGLKDTAEGEGDLTKRLNIARTDEIGMLAKWFDTFVAKLNSIIVDIGSNSETVTSSALEVLSASEQMQQESEELKTKANTVAGSSEDMNVSMTSVAAASEQAATNLGFVAGAASEMREALDDVVTECDRAKDVSRSATDQVQNTTTKVSLLGEAAHEITKVSEVITEIADQTNLLALNATIEAARAGEAGKGFAVVAGEIKGLATQTQQATQQIKTRIAGIQNSTDETVAEVGLIADVITDVDAIISSIAASMTEQSGRATEVSQNIDQASQGISEVNENMAQSSHLAEQIAGDILEVDNVAKEMSERSDNMRQSSGGLSELAGQLREMISVFKVSVEEAKSSRNGGLQKVGGRELFPWNTKLATGVEKIDEQHKKLVSLINSLHQAMKDKAGTQEAGRILNELAEYTKYHFGVEEEIFDTIGYPQTSEHKRTHQELLGKVSRFQKEFGQGKAGLSMELMDFLADWLKDHIMKTDMSYVPFLKDKKI